MGKPGPKQRPIEDRFWEKVEKKADSECWEWKGYLNPAGYGTFYVSRDKNAALAHRVSFEINIGEIPDGLYALHKCDNPKCVNPHHLFLGTHLDNVRDMISKNRRRRSDQVLVGEELPQSILTEDAVRDIRRNPNTPRAVMAEKYGVSISTIKAAKSGQNWRNVK